MPLNESKTDASPVSPMPLPGSIDLKHPKRRWRPTSPARWVNHDFERTKSLAGSTRSILAAWMRCAMFPRPCEKPWPSRVKSGHPNWTMSGKRRMNRKLLLRTKDGHRIESFIIPMEDHAQCVSGQVGCKIGCDFHNGSDEGSKNLSAGEIVDQIYWAQQVMKPNERISNIVYMGMGEPLDNYEQVTNSIGFSMNRARTFRDGELRCLPAASYRKTLGHDVPVNLAISLNATTDATRTPHSH